jgi:hypothetical protein
MVSPMPSANVRSAGAVGSVPLDCERAMLMSLTSSCRVQGGALLLPVPSKNLAANFQPDQQPVRRDHHIAV